MNRALEKNPCVGCYIGGIHAPCTRQEQHQEQHQTAPERRTTETPEKFELGTPPAIGDGQGPSTASVQPKSRDRKEKKDPIKEMLDHEPPDEDWKG